MNPPPEPSVRPFDLRAWLDGIGFGQYADVLDSQGLRLDTLLDLTRDELKDCGITLVGHQKVILLALGELKAQLSEATSAAESRARVTFDVGAVQSPDIPANEEAAVFLEAPEAVTQPAIEISVRSAAVPPGFDALLSQAPSVAVQKARLSPQIPPRNMLVVPLPAALQSQAAPAVPVGHPSGIGGDGKVMADPAEQSGTAKPGGKRKISWRARLQSLAASYKKANGDSMLVSVIIHGIILLIGTCLVVSQFVEERKVSFGGGDPGPKSEVQHKVRMKSTAAPAPTKRITTTSSIARVALPEMPDIPNNMGPTIAGAMGSGGFGAASGLGGGGSGGGSGGGRGNGFSKITFFGLNTKGKGDDCLTGTFYDLKQTRDKQPTGMTVDAWNSFVQDLTSGTWDIKKLQHFYAGPNPLYAPFIFIPIMSADEGPKAFSLEKEVQPRLWIAHYKGKVVPPENGRFRFVGYGDDLLVVRFNGKVVLNQRDQATLANPIVKYNYEGLHERGPTAGLWVEVNAGMAYEMEVLIGECPGGLMHAWLLIEKENASYGKDKNGIPILPVFRLSKAVPPIMKASEIKEQSKKGYAELIGKAPPYSIKEAPWRALPQGPASALNLIGSH